MISNFSNRLTRSMVGLSLALLSPLAGAAIVFTENFEGATNQFGLPVYNYTSNYTLANTLASPGLQYAHGGAPAGGAEVAFQVTFDGPVLSLSALGYNVGAVDSGTLSLNLAAQFSTYRSQNDYALFTAQFLDGSGLAVGDAINVGGSAFVVALPGGTASRGWGSASESGVIPVGARSIALSLTQVKTPQGAFTDGYVDNLSVAVIPEPGTWMLCAVAAASCVTRRRRRSH